MTRDEAKAALAGKMIETYGFEKGLRISGVTADPILDDFLNLCGKAEPGASVSEVYNTEDRKACLLLTGTRTGKGPEILEVKLK